MTRIYVTQSDENLFSEINNALDDAFLEYDIEDGGRYLVNDDNVNEIIDIMESLGADIEII